jgi:uncharacterized protein YndB with AHSA1/START domain
MSQQRSAEHATFVLERTYEAPPERVFAAWASVEAKRQWWGPREDGPAIELDFEVGGRERFVGTLYTYSALYQDIVPGQRIVYTYEMYREQDRISVSVATVEFASAGNGTALRMTEQGVFLDGHDTVAQREEGTRGLLEQLARAVEGS